MSIERMKAELSKAEAEAAPRLDARNIDAEADRVTRAKAKADILRARLVKAEADERAERKADLRKKITEAQRAHDAASGAASEADMGAMLALNAFLSEHYAEGYRDRILNAAAGARSIVGDAHRRAADEAEARLSELTTEARRFEGGR